MFKSENPQTEQPLLDKIAHPCSIVKCLLMGYSVALFKCVLNYTCKVRSVIFLSFKPFGLFHGTLCSI